MKERFVKLLLGEDMSGGGKGVSSALALSNAITNLAGEFHPSLFSPLLIWWIQNVYSVGEREMSYTEKKCKEYQTR